MAAIELFKSAILHGAATGELVITRLYSGYTMVMP